MAKLVFDVQGIPGKTIILWKPKAKVAKVIQYLKGKRRARTYRIKQIPRKSRIAERYRITGSNKVVATVDTKGWMSCNCDQFKRKGRCQHDTLVFRLKLNGLLTKEG